MGLFSKLRAAHHYTSIGVKANLERDEAAKKLDEVRAILVSLQSAVIDAGWNDPRLTQVHTSLRRTIASYEGTNTAYEAAVRACEAVGGSLDAACNNYDWQSVETAWVTATGAVFLAKATAAETVNIHTEFKLAAQALAVRIGVSE